MTSSVLEPAGVIDDAVEQSIQTLSPGETVLASVRYPRREDATVYKIRLQKAAPPNLRVSLELGREDGGVWMCVPELNVSAEGADLREAFLNLLGAVRDWLTYLREDEPELADDLAPQRRYVALLDTPVFSWFKSAHFAG